MVINETEMKYKIVWKEDLWYKKKSLSESFELRFTMHDTQFRGVPVQNLCSCIPDIPTYMLELFLQNIPGTEISIYVKCIYIYTNNLQLKIKENIFSC